MKTVAQAFHDMMLGLELTPDEQQAAQRHQNEVRENLRLQLGGVVRDFLSGSYARNTAIRPLHDIDVFVVLDEGKWGPFKAKPPVELLQRLHGALARAYPNRSIRVQPRSVNIEFAGIGLDMVPAFANASNHYVIPDSNRPAWLVTYPEAHKTALNAANERAGNKLKQLVKAAKHWNRLHGRSLTSFHLEVMSYSAFHQAPGSYAEGLRDLFVHLSRAVMEHCAAPDGVGAHIDPPWDSSQRRELSTRLAAVAESARKAIDHDQSKRTEEAQKIWKKLLGEVYRY